MKIGYLIDVLLWCVRGTIVLEFRVLYIHYGNIKYTHLSPLRFAPIMAPTMIQNQRPLRESIINITSFFSIVSNLKNHPYILWFSS